MNSNAPTEMLILAGGYGTRLRPVVNDVPKPMAPILGRPFLEYLLDYWTTEGVSRFILSTGYLGEVIQEHFGNRYRGATIDYIHEGSPLGTGGALRLALVECKWSERTALMINGDTWFPVDLNLMTADAAQQNKPITIALKLMEKNDRYGGVKVDSNGAVHAFGIKADGRALINAGCYLFEVAIMQRALKGYPDVFSLENDFLGTYASGGRIGSSIQNASFLDIGVPDDYKRAAELLSESSYGVHNV